jgi:hypothetical protein
VGDECNRTLEKIRFFSVALKHDFYEISINLDVVNCARFVNSEIPKNRGFVDNEGRHGFVKRIGVGGGWCPPLLAILPHQTAELRPCAHMARRLVDALENTRSVWVMVPSLWITRWRFAAMAHCWRARRPMRSVWARLSRSVARCPPITRGRSISRWATRSASPMKAAKRVEGMMGSIGLSGRGVVGDLPLA